MHVCVHLSVHNCAIYMHEPSEVRGELWNWSHRQLWDTKQVLGIEPWSFDKTVYILNYGTIFPSPDPSFFKSKLHI